MFQRTMQKRVEEKDFHGTWQVTCHEYLTPDDVKDSNYNCNIEGAEFELDDTNEVIWKTHPFNDKLPFMTSEAYELLIPTYSRHYSCTRPNCTVKFYIQNGETIIFKAQINLGILTLTYEKYFALHCQRVQTDEKLDNPPYSLLRALDDGSYSDLTIIAKDGKHFYTHKCILTRVCPDLHWEASPAPLSGLNSDTIHTILHYAYCGCLPKALSTEVAEKVLKFTKKTKGFEKLEGLLEKYLDTTAVRQRIVSLVDELYSHLSDMVRMVNANSLAIHPSPLLESPFSEPGKFWYLIKKLLQEISVGAAKVVIFSDLYTKRKPELSREERKEVIKFVGSRLPSFIDLLAKLNRAADRHFKAMTEEQLREIVVYLLPEVDKCLQLGISLANDAKAAMEQIVIDADQGHKKDKKERKGAKLSRRLKNAIHMKELLKLKKIQEELMSFFVVLNQKREHFISLTAVDREAMIVRYLQQHLGELAKYQESLDDFTEIDFCSGHTYKDWKTFFKLATSRVTWALDKARTQKYALSPVVKAVCERVSRPVFIESLRELDVLCPALDIDGIEASETDTRPQPPEIKLKVSEEEDVTSPAPASKSFLSKCIGCLFESQQYSDMEFIISDRPQYPLTSSSENDVPPESKETITAHRVVVAARCDWFRMALQSGMKESIDRKFYIEDCSPSLFKDFLRYLYTGILDVKAMTMENLIDLMTLADRYEVNDLKYACEKALTKQVDNTTALCLLSLADNLSACRLKDATMEYVKDNVECCDLDDFGQLSPPLQDELTNKIGEDILIPILNCENRRKPNLKHRRPSYETALMEQHVEFHMKAVQLSDAECNSDSDSEDEESHLCATTSGEGSPQSRTHSPSLEECVHGLRDVLGDVISQERLVQVSLAADFDINRAINFYFENEANWNEP